jgi:cation:H+ antiporter
MVINILTVFFLLVLFYFLSKSADLVVSNLKKIGESLGIRLFFLGIILGIATCLPELAVGFNSIINDIPEVSFGNIIGGNIVLLGLILPISIVLNRRIKTEEKFWPFLVTLAFLFLPLILGLNGSLSYLDGLILMIGYLLLVYYLYRKRRGRPSSSLHFINRRETNESVIFIVIGIVGLIVLSELIVKTTVFILDGYNVSAFIVGLLLYSIGTNLPELTIAIRSFKKKVKELSFSHLIGSSMAHILVLGVLSFIRTIELDIGPSYIFLMIFNFVFFIILYIFYKTDLLLSRLEGVVLLFMYLVFVSGQIFIQLN